MSTPKTQLIRRPFVTRDTSNVLMNAFTKLAA